ncbi:MAG: transglycosylase domain-containing protein [Oscillospiraceae bacterium]|nr:transglycosylase domain-containing protein [Oscillospiraceae bacterium]
MDKEQTVKRKKAPDPGQRTISGAVVHVLWRVIATLLAVCVFLGIAGGVAAVRVYEKGKTYIEEDIIPIAHYDLNGVRLNQSSFILAKNADGDYEEIRQLLAVENRIWVNYEEIPSDMINATVAIEDKRFWEHDGVDWMRTLGASANMFIGGSTYGGSTLTQQLIKNLTGEKDVTVRRKLMEIFKALDFEKNYTKEEIITWYLNTIYLGEGAYGVKSAAHIYFGKELDELTTKECACIVGITNNPSRYDPYIYPENNEYRTRLILQAMLEQGSIPDRETYEQVKEQELEFKSLTADDQKFTCAECGFEGVIDKFEAVGDYYSCPTCGHENQFDVEEKDYYSYFEDTIIRDVSRDLAALKGITYDAANQMVTTGGFRIYSTLDLAAQAMVDEVYQDVSNVPETYSSKQMQSAIVLIDNESGDIVAMAGGVGKKEGNLTWNRATQSRLSPGSSIKPLTVYSPALELGIITPGSAYEDSPYMQLNGKDWPQNNSRRYSGWMLVINGVAQSLNTIAVKVLADVTPENSFNFARERFGLTNLVESEEINGQTFSDINLGPLSMGQLTHGVTVREMATAYASFPNNGVWRKARTYTKVEDAEGNLILDNTQQSHTALSTHANWYMLYMLRYACLYGTGTNAQFNGVPVAGKTGTSSDNRDRWFSGFTPKYTASVWCGFDDPEEIRPVVNLNPAVLMWKAVMTKVMDGMSKEEIGDFVQPDDENFVTVQVCSQTGLLAGPKCTPKAVSLFASDVPENTCDAHLSFDIQICHPDGNAGLSYCANNDCIAYNKIVNSPEFQALAAVVPSLRAFKNNPLERKTLYMLKDGENDNPTLADALKANNILVCPVHTHARLVELQKAVLEAMDFLNPEPDPEPSSDEEPQPPSDEEPEPGPDD